MTRIVSLLPSATEIVCALGAASELVGISHECDFPLEIRDRAVLTSSRIDPHGTSDSIDQAVRGVLQDALSLYAIDEQGLCDARPDVIVTQDLCEVCAVSLHDVRAAVARLAQRDDVRIVSLTPTRLGDVLDDIGRVATAISREGAGAEVRRGLEGRIQAIRDRAAGQNAKPRVVSIEWLEPLMLGGTWMPELIEAAGGVPVGAMAGGPAPTVTLQELAALEPDVVLVKPCGFSLRRSLEELPLIQRLASALPENTRVLLSDGNAFFNRPGPRLVESLEILSACVHPGEFADFERKHLDVLLPVERAG
ncbi:MAG: ABC transporter substrate-binding protein [Polyangiaceae bacterium]